MWKKQQATVVVLCCCCHCFCLGYAVNGAVVSEMMCEWLVEEEYEDERTGERTVMWNEYAADSRVCVLWKVKVAFLSTCSSSSSTRRRPLPLENGIVCPLLYFSTSVAVRSNSSSKAKRGTDVIFDDSRVWIDFFVSFCVGKGTLKVAVAYYFGRMWDDGGGALFRMGI